MGKRIWSDIHSFYTASRDFQSLVAVWVKERRCPLPLVDFLLENGMENAADCARWCATKVMPSGAIIGVERYPYPSITKMRVRGSRTYGRTTKTRTRWYWIRLVKSGYRGPYTYHGVPNKNLDKRQVSADTSSLAILNLLAAWRTNGDHHSQEA